MKQPAIVVIAHNRPHALERLLKQLQRAHYPEQAVPLVISIDPGPDPEVLKVAQDFDWKSGNKRIIHRPAHLGLKNHVLSCGDLVNEYGAVILLEDDLGVGPYFYEFAEKALKKYGTQTQIAGISLYSYQVTENGFCPFHLIDEASETWFIQFPSSWGWVVNERQWNGFRSNLKNPGRRGRLPEFVREWSSQSWKKEMVSYLLSTNKFFVFPKKSHSTNYGNPGTHADTAALFQVPLAQTPPVDNFPFLNETLNVYDVFFELTSKAFRRLYWNENELDVSLDLYGRKDKEFIKSDFVFTARPVENATQSFGKQLLPFVQNIFQEESGGELSLIPTSALPLEKLPAKESWIRQKPISQQLWSSGKPICNKLSLIIPLHGVSGDSLKWLQDFAKNPNPNLEIVLSGTEEEAETIDSLPDQCKIFKDSHNLGSMTQLANGMKVATGELICFLPLNFQFKIESTNGLTRLFNWYTYVDWVLGRPGNLKSNGLQRILLEKFPKVGLEDWEKIFPTGQIVFRRTLWEQAGSQIRTGLQGQALPDLFARFFRKQIPTVVGQNFSFPVQGTGPDSEWLGWKWPASADQLPEPAAKPAGLLKKTILTLSKGAFIKNRPGLRMIYCELAQLPQMLIHEPDKNNYYFWRYD